MMIPTPVSYAGVESFASVYTGVSDFTPRASAVTISARTRKHVATVSAAELRHAIETDTSN